jgi:protoheme IX farnesyltransferase
LGARSAIYRLRDVAALTKPRVMSLAIFTAFVGLTLAPRGLGPLRECIALLSIAAGAGGAAALNMWYEADLDAAMHRTATRPIPRGRVLRGEALAFGLGLAAIGVAVLALINLAAAALLAFTISFYVVIYTIWLKPRTPQNIVIGGTAGALPPAIGWFAAGGPMSVEPFLLFLIILLWTPPHFWALSLERVDEYARAGIPMLPVVVGKKRTKKYISAYVPLLAASSLLPWLLGFTGALYGAIACVCGSVLSLLAIRLYRSRRADETTSARRFFAFSILYLFLLFAGLLADKALQF